jgi:hypothetical protein
VQPTVRVLLVTDDFGINGGHPHGGFLRWQDQSVSDSTGPNSREFHLGDFVQCLQDTPWSGFALEITKAHRATTGTQDMNEAQLKADRGADVVNFHFDRDFTVNGHKRHPRRLRHGAVLCHQRRDPNAAAFQSEADAIARFMEAGGGSSQPATTKTWAESWLM